MSVIKNQVLSLPARRSRFAAPTSFLACPSLLVPVPRERRADANDGRKGGLALTWRRCFGDGCFPCFAGEDLVVRLSAGFRGDGPTGARSKGSAPWRLIG